MGDGETSSRSDESADPANNGAEDQDFWRVLNNSQKKKQRRQSRKDSNASDTHTPQAPKLARLNSHTNRNKI